MVVFKEAGSRHTAETLLVVFTTVLEDGAAFTLRKKSAEETFL